MAFELFEKRAAFKKKRLRYLGQRMLSTSTLPLFLITSAGCFEQFKSINPFYHHANEFLQNIISQPFVFITKKLPRQAEVDKQRSSEKNQCKGHHKRGAKAPLKNYLIP